MQRVAREAYGRLCVYVFSVIWYPIEKRQAVKREKDMEALAEWNLSPFVDQADSPSTYLRPIPHDLVASEHQR
jgi:hypothetical protein